MSSKPRLVSNSVAKMLPTSLLSSPTFSTAMSSNTEHSDENDINLTTQTAEITATSQRIINILFSHKHYASKEVHRFLQLHDAMINKLYIFPLDQPTKLYLMAHRDIRLAAQQKQKLREQQLRKENLKQTINSLKTTSKDLVKSTVSSFTTIASNTTSSQPITTPATPVETNHMNTEVAAQQIDGEEPEDDEYGYSQYYDGEENEENQTDNNDTTLKQSAPSEKTPSDVKPEPPRLYFQPELTHTPNIMDTSLYYTNQDMDNTKLTTISILLPKLVLATPQTTQQNKNDVILTNNMNLPNPKGKGDLLTFLQHTIERTYQFNEMLQAENTANHSETKQLYINQLSDNISRCNTELGKLSTNFSTIVNFVESHQIKREQTKSTRQAAVKAKRQEIDRIHEQNLESINTQQITRLNELAILKDRPISLPSIDINLQEPLAIQTQRYLAHISSPSVQKQL